MLVVLYCAISFSCYSVELVCYTNLTTLLGACYEGSVFVLLRESPILVEFETTSSVIFLNCTYIMIRCGFLFLFIILSHLAFQLLLESCEIMMFSAFVYLCLNDNV